MQLASFYLIELQFEFKFLEFKFELNLLVLKLKELSFFPPCFQHSPTLPFLSFLFSFFLFPAPFQPKSPSRPNSLFPGPNRALRLSATDRWALPIGAFSFPWPTRTRSPAGTRRDAAAVPW